MKLLFQLWGWKNKWRWSWWGAWLKVSTEQCDK